MATNHSAFFLAFLILCVLFANGCREQSQRPAIRYVKPSAVDGGASDPAIRAIEAIGGTCFRYHALKGLLVDRDSFWMEQVEGNPVISVELDDCLACGEFLEHVAQLKHIQNLCIRRSSLTDKESVLIGRLKSLRSLRLENTSFTNKGLLELSKLKLRHLNFDCNQTGDEGVEVISTIGTLEELHLNGTSFTDEGAALLADLDELKYLHIGSTKMTDAGLEPLATSESLREISVTNSNITGVGFQPFSDSKISILKLNHCTVSPAGLRGIAQLPAVEELSLFCCSVTDVGLDSLARMPKLQSLNLYGNSVTQAGLQKLSASKSLRAVDVAQCKVTGSQCKRFNRNSGRLRAIVYDD